MSHENKHTSIGELDLNDIYEIIEKDRYEQAEDKLKKGYKIPDYAVEEAAYFNNIKAVNFLLDHEGKINDRIVNQAALNNNCEMAKILIDHGASKTEGNFLQSCGIPIDKPGHSGVSTCDLFLLCGVLAAFPAYLCLCVAMDYWSMKDVYPSGYYADHPA